MMTISASQVERDYQAELETHLFESLTMLERMLKALTPYASQYIHGTQKYHKVAVEADILVKKIRSKVQQ